MIPDGYAMMLIKEKIMHEVHTSERKSFRGCRRRWDWVYRDNYYPLTTAKPLEFGIAYHKGMEVLHAPHTWHFPKRVLLALAEKAFVDVCEEQRQAYLKARESYGLDTEEQEDYDERIELGRGMLRYYADNQMDDIRARFTPTHVEISFDVPMKDDYGNQLYCKCSGCRRYFARAGGSTKFGKWYGNPVVISGRVDLIVRDSYGQYWIWDWKFYNVNHKILTPTGWVRMGDLQDGDLVIGQNGKSTRILGASSIQPKEVWELELEDGTVAECSSDHKWTVFNRDNVRKIMTTEQLAGAPAYENFGLPVMDQAEFDVKPELIMDPYVLGSLLGDGYFNGGSLSYSSKDGRTVELLLTATDEDVKIHRASDSYNTWTVTGPWMGQLKSLGLRHKLSADKFIPEQYLFASVEERIALLQGLYDTDGLASQLRICTTSGQLAKDICHLVRSLGGKASMPSSAERTHSNKTTVNKAEYFVNFWLPEDIEHCRLEHKKNAKRAKRGTHRRGIVAVRKTERTADMRCIAVDSPDHLYVAEDFVVTHNTAAALTSNEEFLELDDQIATYVWALRVGMGLDIVGFLYHEQRKAFPSPPKANKNIRLGRRYSVAVNQATSYDIYLATVKENDTEAYEAGLYDDYLQGLLDAGTDFYRRFDVTKTEYQLFQVEQHLRMEVLEIINPNLRVFPTPGKFSCSGCAFRGPCIGKNAGHDYKFALDTLYVKQEPYYRRNRKPSTDKTSD